jgi:predicted Zn-dependent protease
MMDRNRRARHHLGRERVRIAILCGSFAAASFAGPLSAQTAAPVPARPAAASASGDAAVAPAPAPSLSEIQKLIDHGHADRALAQLDTMAAASPVPTGVQRLRGLALYSQDKLLSAEQAFAAAMADDPADTAAARMRGIALYRLGRSAAAIPLLEDAARLAQQPAQRSNGPADPEYVLALCYLDTRRYDDARHAFATQYGFPGDSAAAYLLAARLMLRRDFLPVAEQFARKALELSPQLPLAHRLLGETELADNHLEEAAAEFEKERQLNPLDPVTYDRLGDVYVRQGEFEKARASLQEAVLLDPSSTGPFILLGKVLLKQQEPAGASGYLEHARDMDPQNYMTHSLLGQAYRQMGRLDDARAETALAEKLQADAAPKLKDVK